MKTPVINILLAAAAVLTAACSTGVPARYSESDSAPSLKPDYTSLEIPRNIAPLTFSVLDQADGYVSHFRSDKDAGGFVLEGQSPVIPVSRWSSSPAPTPSTWTSMHAATESGRASAPWPTP